MKEKLRSSMSESYIAVEISKMMQKEETIEDLGFKEITKDDSLHLLKPFFINDFYIEGVIVLNHSVSIYLKEVEAKSRSFGNKLHKILVITTENEIVVAHTSPSDGDFQNISKLEYITLNKLSIELLKLLLESFKY